MSQPSSANSTGPRTKNRFLAAIIHIPWYNGRAGVALSRDTGIPTKDLRKILRGQKEPSFQAVVRIARALNGRSKVSLPLEELIVDAEDAFPTEFICELFNCGCTPEWFVDANGKLLPRYEGIPPGKWTFSVPPFEEPN